MTNTNVDIRARYPNVPILDTSSRRTYKKCPRLSYLTNPAPYGEGYRKKLAAPPLFFGTLIHEALDHGYSQRPINYAAMVDYFKTQARAEIITIQRGYKPWPNEAAKYESLYALGVGILEEYARWAPDVDDFEVVETEVAGYVPITASYPVSVGRNGNWAFAAGDGVVIGLYYVRFDGLVRDDRGRLWVFEHKTCNNWWNDEMLLLDEQITAYTWAAEQLYHEPVAGVLINFLRKEVVEDPPRLKDGHPTTSMSRLGRVTAERYRAALGSGLNYGESLTLHNLLEREKEEGHPTLRREKISREPYTILSQGARIARELRDMTRPDQTHSPAPSFLCHSCPMSVPCTQLENGDDWGQTMRLWYEQRRPIWDEVVEDDDDH